MKNLLLLLIGVMLSYQINARVPATGQWFSPNHNGHGIDLQKAGQVYTVIFYTYDEDNNPTWFLGVANWQSDDEVATLTGDFNSFNHDPAAINPIQLVGKAGEFELTFDQPHAACESLEAAHHALFTWRINGQEGAWCMVNVLAQINVRQMDFTGHYYSGEADTGWGFSLDYQGYEGAQTAAALVYYYDQSGYPRWSIGSGLSTSGDSTLIMNNVIGYCRTCTPTDLQVSPIGHLDVNLDFIDHQRTGSASLQLTYPNDTDTSWQRSDAPLFPLSELEPGILPLPETIDQSTLTAVIDVSVVPMTPGFPIWEHRNVVFENGLITDINQDPQFASEFIGTTIDGRGLHLAPGMSEMHLHITTGGREAAEQAGLLMIANGITTALNAGSTFSISVPELADKFEQGELIGPTFYTGQVAYGTRDGAGPDHTVASAEEATLYAELLHAGSYDFIKVYWQLTVQTINQFFVESERLNLPIIGHLPRTQLMFRSLSQGQKLAVHIQEPYVTHLNGVRDESKFPEISEIFLEHGAYLSPTLAVFESYVMISNNHVATYNEYINREGNQYTPQSVKQIWQNYFNQPYIQVADRENLLDLFDFFMKMTKALYDSGVPLLSGTDATGFPGVMAGYGVHEELRLLNEAGIPVDEVFAITTRNAGQFIADTLDEPVKFGTIEIGNRADMILTTENPLSSLETIKKPMGVMARGRFWSQEHLQDLLDSLPLNQQKTMPAENQALPYCNHHNVL